jgi:hypothetical protein
MAQYQSAIKDIRKDDREAVKGLIELGLTKEKFMQEVQKMGLDWHKSERAYDASVDSARINNAGRLAAATAGRQPKSVTPGDIQATMLGEGRIIDTLKAQIAAGKPLTPEQQARFNTAESNLKYYSQFQTEAHPPPSNLSGVAGIATGESGAVNNALAKWSGQDALDIAYLANNEPVIKKLTAEKATIEAKARQEYRQSLKEAGGMSNRPLNSTGGAGAGGPGAGGPGAGGPGAGGAGAGGANGAAPAGSVNAPSLPDFLAAARKVNPNASDEQLTAYYKQKYGR